jgi:hypothetical protein
MLHTRRKEINQALREADVRPRAGINRRLGQRLPPCYFLRLPATMISFATGLVSLTTVVLALQFVARMDLLSSVPQRIQQVHWSQYFAGLLGVSLGPYPGCEAALLLLSKSAGCALELRPCVYMSSAVSCVQSYRA